MKEIILEQVTKTNGSTSKQLVDRLGKNGISLIFRQNNDGRIYGLTYVDHNTKCVFNGSDLGKAFSAKAVLEIFKKPEAQLPEPTNGNIKTRSGQIPNSSFFGDDHAKSSGDGLLNFLFEKPSSDLDTPLMGITKKKKKKGHSKNRDLSNKI